MTISYYNRFSHTNFESCYIVLFERIYVDYESIGGFTIVRDSSTLCNCY